MTRIAEVAQKKMDETAHRMAQEGNPFPAEILLACASKMAAAAEAVEAEQGLIRALPVYKMLADVAAEAATYVHRRAGAEKPIDAGPGEVRIQWEKPDWLKQRAPPEVLPTPHGPTSTRSTNGRSAGR